MHSFIVFLKASERRLLLQRLNSTSGRIDSVLKKSLPFGIAYHHSGTLIPLLFVGLIENQIGLTVDERALIEKAHYQRVICVICCTSTLAAGKLKLKISLSIISMMLNASFFRCEFASAKGNCQIT